MTTDATRAAMTAAAIASLNETLAAVRAWVPAKAYVIQWAENRLCVRENGDRASVVGICHATTYNRGDRYPTVRNGKDEIAKPTPVETARARVIADLEQSLASLEGAAA